MSRFEDVVTHGIIPRSWAGCSGEHLVGPGQLLEVARWCRNTFVNDTWIRMGYDFWFKDERDAFLFKLRWSGGSNENP